jgi:pyridoxine 5'-phosphate synthase PdxJ
MQKPFVDLLTGNFAEIERMQQEQAWDELARKIVTAARQRRSGLHLPWTAGCSLSISEETTRLKSLISEIANQTLGKSRLQ